MVTTRRDFLSGLIGTVICAPAIVRASSLMPIKVYKPDVVCIDIEADGFYATINGKPYNIVGEKVGESVLPFKAYNDLIKRLRPPFQNYNAHFAVTPMLREPRVTDTEIITFDDYRHLHDFKIEGFQVSCSNA